MNEPAVRREDNVTHLGSALAIRAEQDAFNRAQIEALKKMNGWDRVPEAELSVFFHQAQRTGLDPFAKQIYLIGRRNNRANRTDYTIQTSIDGMRLVADRTGRYAGSDRPVFGEDNGDKYAEVTVWKVVGGTRVPFTGVAYEDEFRQDRSPMWQRMPRTMLAKCAEAQALRKAFPADLSGIYGSEEMDQAGRPVNTPEEVGGQADGEALEVEAAEVVDEDPQAAADRASADPERGDVLKSQIGRIENLSEWIWGEKRAVEQKVLKGHRIEELTRNGAKSVIDGLQKTKERMQAAEHSSATTERPDEAQDVDEEPAPHPDEVEGVERGGAARQDDKGGLPATRKQLNYLEALIVDVDEDGMPGFEEMVGKPLGELTREEASEWINRLSGRQP